MHARIWIICPGLDKCFPVIYSLFVDVLYLILVFRTIYAKYCFLYLNITIFYFDKLNFTKDHSMLASGKYTFNRIKPL